MSHNIFLQGFPARFSHKVSCKIFPQDFPELDPDWLAPHHPIPNAKFPPITAFLKLAFSPPPCPSIFSCKIFLQEFPAIFSHKNFLQVFPARICHKIFPQEFPTTFFCKNFLQYFPTRMSHKIFLQGFPARFSHKNFPQEFPTRFTARISHKIFLSWILIGCLPITLFQMLNFRQSLPFLNWLFPLLPVLQYFPARFSRNNFPQDFPTRISHNIFPQDFPARFSCKNFLQGFLQDFSATFSRAGS